MLLCDISELGHLNLTFKGPKIDVFAHLDVYNFFYLVTGCQILLGVTMLSGFMPIGFLISTSNQVRIPAELKHINKRRKRK